MFHLGDGTGLKDSCKTYTYTHTHIYIYIYIYLFIYIFDLATVWAMNWACALKSHGWVGPAEVGLGVKKNPVYQTGQV